MTSLLMDKLDTAAMARSDRKYYKGIKHFHENTFYHSKGFSSRAQLLIHVTLLDKETANPLRVPRVPLSLDPNQKQ